MAWIGEAILTAMPANQGCATIVEIAEATGLDRDQISKAVSRMAARGLCVRAQKGSGAPGKRDCRLSCYRRTPAGDAALAAGVNLKGGPNKPHGKRDPGLRGRVWRAIRTLRKATVVELLELALDGKEKSGETAKNNARRYIAHLEAQGILARLKRKAPGIHAQSRGQVQFVLVKDVGPNPPVGPS